MKIQENVPMAGFTTLGVGGPARLFVAADSEAAIEEAVRFAAREGMPIFVLGGGSNILVSDEGFPGLVLHIASGGVEFKEDGDAVCVTAAAGEDWDGLVEECVRRDLAGFECLSGIPGSVGGTPVQNVGAYGQEVSETISLVRCFDRPEMRFVELSNEECGFSYRKSIFNTTKRERYIVTSVTYELRKGGEPKVVYKDLTERFADSRPTLCEVRDTVLEIRRAKSMVIDANDRNSRSAGSFFKNPIVPLEKIGEIAKDLVIEDVPFFRVDEREVKIPAAWLIERAGFAKGFALGRAGISENHSLAIVNRGGATAAEIIALKDLIQERVFERFGMGLEPEPVFVGI